MAILASFGHPAGGVLHQPLAPGPRGSRRAHPRPGGTPPGGRAPPAWMERGEPALPIARRAPVVKGIIYLYSVS